MEKCSLGQLRRWQKPYRAAAILDYVSSFENFTDEVFQTPGLFPAALETD